MVTSNPSTHVVNGYVHHIECEAINTSFQHLELGGGYCTKVGVGSGDRWSLGMYPQKTDDRIEYKADSREGYEDSIGMKACAENPEMDAISYEGAYGMLQRASKEIKQSLMQRKREREKIMVDIETRQKDLQIHNEEVERLEKLSRELDKIRESREGVKPEEGPRY